METIRYIKSLEVTSIVTNKAPKHEQNCQSNVKLTSKIRINTPHKMANIEATMLFEGKLFASNKASEDRKKSKKSFITNLKNSKYDKSFRSNSSCTNRSIKR